MQPRASQLRGKSPAGTASCQFSQLVIKGIKGGVCLWARRVAAGTALVHTAGKASKVRHLTLCSLTPMVGLQVMLDELPPAQSGAASKAVYAAQGTARPAHTQAIAPRNTGHQQQVCYGLSCCLMSKSDSPLATVNVRRARLMLSALQFHASAWSFQLAKPVQSINPI